MVPRLCTSLLRKFKLKLYLLKEYTKISHRWPVLSALPKIVNLNVNARLKRKIRQDCMNIKTWFYFYYLTTFVSCKVMTNALFCNNCESNAQESGTNNTTGLIDHQNMFLQTPEWKFTEKFSGRCIILTLTWMLLCFR